MIVLSNHLGNVRISKEFFASLIGGTVINCFGVVDTNAVNVRQTLLESLPFPNKKKCLEKGVAVKINGNSLEIDIHITVLYGVNVSSIVKSIKHKVRYAVEEETDMQVEKINVFIDGIKT